MANRFSSSFPPDADFLASLAAQFEALPPWALLAMRHKELYEKSFPGEVCPPAVLVERGGVGFCLIVLDKDDNQFIFRVIVTAASAMAPTAITFISEAWFSKRDSNNLMDQEFCQSLDDGSVKLSDLAAEGRGGVESIMMAIRRQASGEFETALLPFAMLGPLVGWIADESRVVPGGGGLKCRLVSEAMAESVPCRARIEQAADQLRIKPRRRLRYYVRSALRLLREEGCQVLPLVPGQEDLFAPSPEEVAGGP